jgi:hypothetical protein
VVAVVHHLAVTLITPSLAAIVEADLGENPTWPVGTTPQKAAIYADGAGHGVA